ncbi:MAG: hypothetical protein KF805_12450 [Phycisphaeraceae bacterium]|nr:hypothetical protein [Phycisphaeraceae bacterium]
MAVTKSVNSKLVVRALIAGSEIAIKKGSASFTKQISDATGSTSGGWMEHTVGNRGMTFTLEGDVKSDAPQVSLSATNAISIPASADNESVAFKLYFADGSGVEGIATILCNLSGDPQGGQNVGWTMNGTANGAVTAF